MKTKIKETVDRHAGDADDRAKTQCTNEAAAGPQVPSRLTKDDHNERNSEREPDRAAAGEQLEIIVVSFLRHERTRSVVIRSDADPVTAEPGAEQWMRFEEPHRSAPDFVATCVFSRAWRNHGRGSCRCQVVREVVCEPVAANPQRAATDTRDEHDCQCEPEPSPAQ